MITEFKVGKWYRLRSDYLKIHPTYDSNIIQHKHMSRMLDMKWHQCSSAPPEKHHKANFIDIPRDNGEYWSWYNLEVFEESDSDQDPNMSRVVSSPPPNLGVEEA